MSHAQIPLTGKGVWREQAARLLARAGGVRRGPGLGAHRSAGEPRANSLIAWRTAADGGTAWPVPRLISEIRAPGFAEIDTVRPVLRAAPSSSPRRHETGEADHEEPSSGIDWVEQAGSHGRQRTPSCGRCLLAAILSTDYIDVGSRAATDLSVTAQTHGGGAVGHDLAAPGSSGPGATTWMSAPR